MLFYGYLCCMKKHDIASDTPNFCFNNEDDEFLGNPSPRDGSVREEGHTLGDRLFAKDGSHGEQTCLFFFD